MTNLKDELMPQDMSFKDLLENREKLVTIKEDLEAGISVYNEEILSRLNAEKLTGKIVGNMAISKVTRTSFELTLEEAEHLGAIKSVIDTEALRSLQRQGAKIPFKTTEYITVKEIANGNSNE